jgi:hypothetical protein
MAAAGLQELLPLGIPGKKGQGKNDISIRLWEEMRFVADVHETMWRFTCCSTGWQIHGY